MKKVLLSLVIMLTAITSPLLAKGGDNGLLKKYSREKYGYIEDETKREERLVELEERVYEIRDMDLENMERSERKVIRNELKDIQKEMKVQGGGLYISVGAAIIIVLLLIILL